MCVRKYGGNSRCFVGLFPAVQRYDRCPTRSLKSPNYAGLGRSKTADGVTFVTFGAAEPQSPDAGRCVLGVNFVNFGAAAIGVVALASLGSSRDVGTP